MTRSLYERGREQPRYIAGYMECLGCKTLAIQQEKQRIIDARAHRARTSGAQDAELVEHAPTSHRHWIVQPAD